MKAAFDNHVGKCVSCLECDSSNRCSVCVLGADTDWATITRRRVRRESMRKRSMPSAALGAPPKRARSESGESPNLEIPLPPLPFSPLPTVPSDIGEIEVATSIPSPCNASTPTPDKFNFFTGSVVFFGFSPHLPRGEDGEVRGSPEGEAEGQPMSHSDLSLSSPGCGWWL